MLPRCNTSNFIVIFTVFVVFLVLYKQRQEINKGERADQPISVQTDQWIDGWQKCMEEEFQNKGSIVQQKWYFFRLGVQRCKNKTDFLKIPLTGLGVELEFSEFGERFHIFNGNMTTPSVIVTTPLGSTLYGEKKMRLKLRKESRFYGTFSFSNDSLTKTADQMNVTNEVIPKIDLAVYLKSLNEPFIDQLSINEAVEDISKVFETLSEVTVCQINILLTNPDEKQKKEMLEVMEKIVMEGEYVILSFSYLYIFMVNYGNQMCRENYVTPYLEV